MKALIIGSKERYEQFRPDTAFSRSVETVYVPLGTAVEDIPAHALDGEFLAVDAIAPVPGELIARMPNLKLIHSEGVAYNTIDRDTARERGIFVCNNRGINAQAVAEQTVLLMLGLLRQVVPAHRAVLEGRQYQVKERLMVEGITELGDCAVGLIGFGDIAQAVARRLAPWGCKVYYNATRRKSAELEAQCHVTWMERPELLATCDMVSIHVPVTPETRGMVNEDFLRQMKESAFLINTARGDMVDNEALCLALTRGWIAGAGLDTIAPEPVERDNPLLNLPAEVQDRLLLSPHIGGVTTSTFKRAHRNIWEAFQAVSQGERPRNIVNGL